MKRNHHSVITYTKKDIVKRVVEVRKSSSGETARWVDEVIKAIRSIMMSSAGELRIEIRDFGVLEVKQTKPKPRARNPHTGEIVFVPARRKTHFKPGKLLKEFLSQPINGSRDIE
jgi:integration host factor subunit beta